MSKQLIILTGPPGAGKLTYAQSLGHPVFDQRLGNKSMWRDHKDGPAVLVTAAPSGRSKQYWLDYARRYGFAPRLVVIDPGEGRATSDLLAREKGLTEQQRRRLALTVRRWYKDYSAHDEELAHDAG